LQNAAKQFQIVSNYVQIISGNNIQLMYYTAHRCVENRLAMVLWSN